MNREILKEAEMESERMTDSSDTTIHFVSLENMKISHEKGPSRLISHLISKSTAEWKVFDCPHTPWNQDAFCFWCRISTIQRTCHDTLSKHSTSNERSKFVSSYENMEHAVHENRANRCKRERASVFLLFFFFFYSNVFRSDAIKIKIHTRSPTHAESYFASVVCTFGKNVLCAVTWNQMRKKNTNNETRWTIYECIIFIHFFPFH